MLEDHCEALQIYHGTSWNMSSPVRSDLTNFDKCAFAWAEVLYDALDSCCHTGTWHKYISVTVLCFHIN